ncbi:hypothetical protein KC330_g3922 [Hortaea werneckii]|nr:hypothetical protein KC330_g3922 [Hortaea werneckii]
MAIHQEDSRRLVDTLHQTPNVSIFLKPIAPPAALGLAGFAGSTFITASWIAGWWVARDVILATLLFFLAIGSTIACSLFNPESARGNIKAAAYFWIFSAILAWWRSTVYLIEEAYSADSKVTKFFPIFRTPWEKKASWVISGIGEPGVKRGVPKMVSEKGLLAGAEQKEGNGHA